jgi:hypothetical protein
MNGIGIALPPMDPTTWLFMIDEEFAELFMFC